MNCASCGRDNRPNARFCSGCGQSLAPRCARCGSENAADAQFCDSCGAPLGGAPRAAEGSARKVVTIVFADLIGSVGLHERLDAENARRFTARYHEAMSDAVRAHGGTVVQLLGDGVLTAFGVPRVSEDDAIRGVRAAVAMQAAFRELLRQQAAAVGAVGLRVAVNTGEVVVSDDQTSVIGDPTNVAARLQQEARDGDVLIGEATQRLVAEQVTLAPLGSFAIRGRVEPVSAFRVVSLEPPAGAHGTPFVGREEELRKLRAVFDAAVAAPGPRLAVLLGSPGLGKSRLLGELSRRLRDRATVLMARCDSARGRSFAPLAAALRVELELGDASAPEAVRAAIDAVVAGSDAERARIATGIAAVLAGAPPSPEETFFVVRRLLAALTTRRPVVLAIDDVQWAEPLLLDLAEHLVQWSSGVPLFVLLGARPELRELRSALATPGGVVAEVLTLGGLDAGAATRLAANAIGADELPAALVGRVLAASEGNPLFVGELVRMLVHDGALKREGERWVAGVELARFEMPPTIHALLAARIERLGPEERAILERAAVIGRHFSRAALAHLLQRAPEELDARLESLRRSELIEPDAGWYLGEPALRFHHALIRDAAYRRVLRRTRAELHESLAEWVAARVGDAPEHDEQIGWHLEQAHEHLRGLGPLDAVGAALGARAARHLGAAGRLALARDDLRPAADLLGRALACLDADDPARADLALDWCEGLLAAGEVGPAARALAELGRFAASSERVRAWHACFAAELAVLTDPQSLHASAERAAAAAATLAAAGDVAGEAKAHSVHATALSRLGQIGASEAALDRALAAARRAHDRRRANGVLAGAPVAALYGPSPVARASGRCLDVVRVLRITQGAPAVEAVALRCQAVLEALRGRTDAARRMIAAARATVEELGITPQLLEVEFFAGYIELLEGDPEAAARCLSVAYRGLREHGLGIDAARAAALLARARLAQGDAIGSEVLSLESEALAGDDLNAAIAWRGVRAEALARRGEHAAAIELARAAVEIASATDALLQHANARRALAAALRAAGRDAEADAEDARAIELWEAKGATLLVESARGESAGAPASPALLSSELAASRPRVRPNAATAHIERFDAAVAARDVAAIADTVGPSWVGVNHTTGASYDWERNFAVLKSLLQGSLGLEMTHTPIAGLGESLVLVRRATTFSELAIDAVSFGAVERDDFALVEVDAEGRNVRVEFFAGSELAAAVTRLYERHAELQPEGPDRARARGVARACAALYDRLEAVGSARLDSLASAFAPEIEFVDFRTVGAGVARGLAAVRESIGALYELAASLSVRIREVLAASPDALVVRCASSGVLQDGGGTFEGEVCQLCVFGPDGRLARWEQFDAGREAEALARFDALARGAPLAVSRVAPNAATAFQERVVSAFRARDPAAIGDLLADGFSAVDWNGASYGAADLLKSFSAMTFGDLSIVYQPLASLGERVTLGHQTNRFAAATMGSLDTGPGLVDSLIVIQVDACGRGLRSEMFNLEQTGDAIVRLYERYADELPTGAPRNRAAAIARSAAAMLGSLEVEALRAALSPEIEVVDHRSLGTWSARGLEPALAQLRSLLEVADAISIRDQLLALRADALLTRRAVTGAQRASGGDYASHLLLLLRFDAAGLISRIEYFDADREAEALARFEELGRAGEPAHPRRRVATNHATEVTERMLAASAARELVHTTEPLAALGERLALFRRVRRFGGLDNPQGAELGPTVADDLLLVQAGPGPIVERVEVFAEGQLGDAVVRLYESCAELLPEGPHRARAAGSARAIAAMLGPLDLARYATAFAPEVESVDHRLLGFGTVRGSAALLRGFGVLGELAETTTRMADVLACDADVLAMSWSTWGTDRRGGGAFEKEFLVLWEFGPDGRVVRREQFDGGREDDALARFDALSAAAKSRSGANAASRAIDRFAAAWNARDWDGVVACYAPGHEMDDRRPLFRTEVRAEFLANERYLFELPASRWHSELVATRGDRLALVRIRFSAEAEGGGGPIAVEVLDVVEVDAAGRRSALVVFEPDALEAAYAELERRFREGAPAMPVENAATRSVERFMRGLEMGDWEGVGATLAPGFRCFDRRRMTRLELDREEFVAFAREVFDELRSPQLSSQILATRGERLAAVQVMYAGAGQTVGRSEIEFLAVVEVDERGDRTAMVRFDPDDLDALYAELDERFAAGEGAAHPALLATTRAVGMALRGRHWGALAALLAPDFEERDHGPLGRVTLSGSEYLAVLRGLVELAPDTRSSLDHLWLGAGWSLTVTTWRGTRDGGAFEMTRVAVNEFDAEGRQRRVDLFGPEQLAEARALAATLEARAGLSDAAPQPALATPPGGNAATRANERFMTAYDARDWDELARLTSPALVFEDRRRHVQIQGGRELYLTNIRVMSPGTRTRRMLLAAGGERLALYRTLHTARGGLGEFEVETLSLVEIDAEDRLAAILVFEPDAEGEARAELAARAEALAAARPDALRIPPNAALRASDRLERLGDAHDWNALRELCAGVAMEDRRPLFGITGDAETLIANARWIRQASLIQTRTLLATAGERLALERIAFAGPHSGIAVEILQLVEVDGAGRIAAFIVFGPEQRAEAYDELTTRLACGEAAHWPPAIVELIHSLRERDLVRLARVLPVDLVIHDHRRTGIGRIEGAAPYIASVAALFEQVENFHSETLYWIAIEANVSLAVARTSGTLRVGGGEFESVFLRLVSYDATGITGIELFELDDEERARAQVAALRADLLRIPLNAAARVALERFAEIVPAGDWDGLRALAGPEFRFEDRRKISLVSGDIELYVRNLEYVRSLGPIFERRRVLVATGGDRLALMRYSAAGEADGGRFELNFLVLTALDAEGRLCAILNFDPDDRRAAGLELLERFVRSGAPPPAARALAMYRALYERDLARMRADLPPGFFFHDHRRVGPGRLEGDAYVEWQAGLVELSPDAIVEPIYFLDVEPHGCLAVGHTFGTEAHGGSLETVFLLLWGPVGVELFEIDDLAKARARFAELRPDPFRVPLNAAARLMRERLAPIVKSGDWAALRALAAPDFEFDDRRKRALVRGDLEVYVRNQSFVHSWGEVATHRETLATSGERLVLERFAYRGATDGGGAFEGEFLRLAELDAQGRLRAILHFDPDDRRAASRELLERSDPSPMREFWRAVNDRDPARMREVLRDDFVFDDHRRTGVGRIEGVDGWLASLAPLWEGSPDLFLEPLCDLASDSACALVLVRNSGHDREGGEFERLFLRVHEHDGERFVSVDLFEPEDLERARARFAELRAWPPGVAPNAAARLTSQMLRQIVLKGDWDSLRALASPEFEFDDRRKGALVRGGIEVYVRNLEFVLTWGDLTRRVKLLATRGERLALERFDFRGGADGGAFEGSFLRLTELDPDGRVRAVLHFDYADVPAAEAEMDERFRLRPG